MHAGTAQKRWDSRYRTILSGWIFIINLTLLASVRRDAECLDMLDEHSRSAVPKARNLFLFLHAYHRFTSSGRTFAGWKSSSSVQDRPSAFSAEAGHGTPAIDGSATMLDCLASAELISIAEAVAASSAIHSSPAVLFDSRAGGRFSFAELDGEHAALFDGFCSLPQDTAIGKSRFYFSAIADGLVDFLIGRPTQALISLGECMRHLSHLALSVPIYAELLHRAKGSDLSLEKETVQGALDLIIETPLILQQCEQVDACR